MNLKVWSERIAGLPQGMTLSQASKLFQSPYSTIRYWLKKLEYHYDDGRSIAWDSERKRKISKVDKEKIDWTKNNAVIARELGVSRERIRQLRNELKVKKVKKSSK